MSNLQQRLTVVRNRVLKAKQLAGRNGEIVTLLAVSKTRSADELIPAYRLGQRHFGENYLQEALNKQQSLSDFRITWHFIGPIQSNKTRDIARCFSWVHSVDRLKIAKRLSEQRPDYLPALNICIQVNVSEEPSKSGVSSERVPELVAAVSELPRLRIKGLMTIPAPATDERSKKIPFRKLNHLFRELSSYNLDTLSMGMSNDLEAAIAEGSTIVRVGTAIFG